MQNDDAVAWITHPRVPDHPDHELAKRILPKGAGSIISFGVKGGRAAEPCYRSLATRGKKTR